MHLPCPAEIGMSVLQSIALILPLLLWLTLVGGMLSFDGVAFWSSDSGSLGPGMWALEADRTTTLKMAISFPVFWLWMRTQVRDWFSAMEAIF
ncbi:hypothetical protein BC835DRAFT_1455968 [Cytidiella melzeri]|nr:hypothetical protein BC835DRAFT_1455968 [Cytidiella melzeri]